MQPMRVAWFSPVPPERSGVAAYTAEVIPLLRDAFEIDVYAEANAHDFVWKHRLARYDLVVYQLGNARCHDYMWGYLVTFPGLVVLHDARLHHARARLLLAGNRADDYRAEFRYDHPAAPPDAAEYAIEGLGGRLNYFWPMLRVPVTTARTVAVHNAFVARELAIDYPTATIETIRMGVPAPSIDADVGARLRRQLDVADDEIVFAAFGKVTPEKRIEAILQAIADANADGCTPSASVMLVGDVDGNSALVSLIERAQREGRVRIMGYVPDAEIGNSLSAADVCLCLRWPSALETSASWLRCLAASKPTVISDLAHLADIRDSVALRVDVADERQSLGKAVQRLVADGGLRERLARAGHAHWAENHRLEDMAADYRRVITAAAARPAPSIADLPAHFVADHAGLAIEIARQFGTGMDIWANEPQSD
jgi:glycosyltransferase involved in cell wall biosynthesis